MKKLLLIATLLFGAHAQLSAADLPREINTPKLLANLLFWFSRTYMTGLDIERTTAIGDAVNAIRKQAQSSTSQKIGPELQASLDYLAQLESSNENAQISLHPDYPGIPNQRNKKLMLKDVLNELAAGKNILPDMYL